MVRCRLRERCRDEAGCSFDSLVVLVCGNGSKSGNYCPRPMELGASDGMAGQIAAIPIIRSAIHDVFPIVHQSSGTEAAGHCEPPGAGVCLPRVATPHTVLEQSICSSVAFSWGNPLLLNPGNDHSRHALSRDGPLQPVDRFDPNRARR